MHTEALTWDSVIKNDSSDKKPLPEGDYPFTVTNMVRGSYAGSAKIGPCPKAILSLDVKGTTIKDTLFLTTALEWRIAEFLRSIGQRKHGDAIKADWTSVVGSTGTVHITISQYTDRYGNTHEVNKVSKYLDPVSDDDLDIDEFYYAPEDDDEKLPFD